MGEGYQVDFGDAPTTSNFATIYGTVFNDVDGNGERGADEVGIRNVPVALDGGEPILTDDYGRYSFGIVVTGMHTVVETDLESYFSTTPNTVTLGIEWGEGYRVDFGDAPISSAFASIHGTVFEDLDSDGEWDVDEGVNEPGLSDVTITLDGEKTPVTDLYGRYSFTSTVVGSHTVVETDLPNYFSTTPNTVTLSVELGHGYPVNFGDVQAGICTCPADLYEEDDDPTQAVELGPGVIQAHDCCDDATDWYTFTVKAHQVYTITTSSWGQRVDTFLALYDTDAQTLLAANDDYEGTTNYSSRIVWQAPADGVYYARITNRGGLSGCYTGYDVWLEVQEAAHLFLPIVLRNYPASPDFYLFLPIVLRNYPVSSVSSSGEQNPSVTAGEIAMGDLELAPLGIISHTCPDIYELDDTWEQARPITDAVQVHSFDSDPVQWVPDKDYVWFDMPTMGAITFTVSVTNTSTLMELWDEFGDALDVSTTGSQLVWDGDSGRRYYLSVSPQADMVANFGCANEVGYHLEAEILPIKMLYLPIVLRSHVPQ